MARKNHGTRRRWTLWGDDTSAEALDQDHRADRGRSADQEAHAEAVRARLYATSAYLTAAT
ncbi:hypothetical protein [Streptomyces sp. NPDC049813]|uniref:hypothetical protein n=1 Tax=Streptomyces sp. NPDC049813 TaxID=3365597 RepID=UPI0037909EF4